MKFVYSAVFVNKDELKKKYPPIHPNEYYHHSTIEFKPNNIDNLPIGENINLKIIGRLKNDKVDALLVENSLSKNQYPHITLSTAEGIKPFESNSEIINNLDKIEPLNDSIIGVCGVFDGSKIITNMSEKLNEYRNRFYQIVGFKTIYG